MGGGIADDSIANIEFLGGMIGRDSDGLEDVLTRNDSMGLLWRDI